MTVYSAGGGGRPCRLPVRAAAPTGRIEGELAGWRIGDPASPHKVLFLHGVGITKATWRGVLPMVAPIADCVSVDLLGFGHSVRRRGAVTMAAQTAVVPAVLDALGWRSAVLVGHSMGGGTALGTALLAPRRVDALVLIASVGLPQVVPPLFRLLHLPGAPTIVWLTAAAAVYGGLKGWLGSFMAIDPVAAEDCALAISRREVALALVEAVRDLRPSIYRRYGQLYSAVRCPVLLIHGRQDDIVPPEVPLRLAELLPNNELLWFDRAAHLPHERHPEQVGAAIASFVRRVPVAHPSPFAPRVPSDRAAGLQ